MKPHRSVLFIDDDPELPDFVSGFLEEIHVQTQVTPELPTAFRMVSETSVDVVVIDLMLFGWDGFSVSKSCDELQVPRSPW